MKKFITAFTLFIVSAQFFSVLGQKINRLPQREIKSVEAPATKNPAASGVSSVEAFSEGNGVFLKWKTENENELIGFNIYRYDGEKNICVNRTLILSTNVRNQPAAQNGSDYDFFDENGSLGNTYTIETVTTGMKKSASTPVVPAYTSDLKSVAGNSSQELARSKSDSQSIVESNKVDLSRNGKLAKRASGSLADPVNQRWVAAQPGVKLTITKEGFYRVTRSELQAAGFDVNADVNRWQLYFNGEEQAIIADPSGQYIEFYGAAPVETLENADSTYYLLAGSTNGKRIDTRTVRPVGGTIPATTFYQTQTKKERLTYLPTVLNGDSNNFFGTFVSIDPSTVTFNVRGLDYSIRKTEIYINVQGLSLTPHTTGFEINGEDMGTVDGYNRDNMQIYITIPTQFLVEGANTLKMKTLGGASDYSMFDQIEVRVQRKYIADDNQLSFYTNDFRSNDVFGFTSSNIRIFDITNDGRPTILSGFTVSQENGVYSANIPAFQTRKMYALTDAAIKQVAAIKQNIPSTIATEQHNPQFVIISHKNFLAQAEIWANYRRSQGMTVEVFDIEDIYDEFNYGKLGEVAIRNFAAYAENEWNAAPGYVMLIGDGTYDPRDYYALGNFNFVPTKLVDTIYTETGSDDALTDLDDDGLAEIPIGRLPVRTPEEVTHLLNKVMSFETNIAQGFDRGVLCASDLPNGYDFAALCSRVMNELPESITKNYVNRGEANSANLLLDQINSGKFFVNYSGHGHTTIWATGGFFGTGQANALTNNDLSIFTMLTCLNGYFIEPAESSISLSETLLKTQKGAVVTWASTGLTTPDIQEIMARRFYHQVGVGNLTRLGDLINDSKTVIPGGRDVRLSWVLLGDPTLKVRP